MNPLAYTMRIPSVQLGSFNFRLSWNLLAVRLRRLRYSVWYSRQLGSRCRSPGSTGRNSHDTPTDNSGPSRTNSRHGARGYPQTTGSSRRLASSAKERRSCKYRSAWDRLIPKSITVPPWSPSYWLSGVSSFSTGTSSTRSRVLPSICPQTSSRSVSPRDFQRDTKFPLARLNSKGKFLELNNRGQSPRSWLTLPRKILRAGCIAACSLQSSSAVYGTARSQGVRTARPHVPSIPFRATLFVCLRGLGGFQRDSGRRGW
jgi:hypothetical protein